MNTVEISSTNLTPENIQFSAAERETFRHPRTLRLVIDLTLPWLQAFFGVALFLYSPGFFTWLIAVVLISGGQHGLSLVSHEAVHRLLWPTSKKINDFIATYFFAAPSLLPFNVYRQRHLLHHRLVSMRGDTKTYYLRNLQNGRWFSEIVRSITGIDYLVQAMEALQSGKVSDDFDNFENNLSKDKRSLLIVHGAIFFAFFAVDPLHYGIPTYYVLLWLGPMVTVSLLFGKLRSIVEHQPPPEYEAARVETEFFKNTQGPMLRSVHATWPERLILSKINFHYHAEHHLWPWISYQHLPAVNHKIWSDIEPGTLRLINDNVITCDKSYGNVLLKLVRGH
ncbi:MAG: fatty acid desaturase [Halioglobus sp.]